MTTNTRKSEGIVEQLLDLSTGVIRYLDKRQDIPRSVSTQLIRAVTSIGANYTEAQNASSKRDFINKIFIAKKESEEAKYWFQLVVRLVGMDDDLSSFVQTTQHFCMMLQKIINTANNKQMVKDT